MNILCWRQKQRHLSTVFPIVTLAFIIRCDRQHSIFVSFRIVNNIEVWLLNIALFPLAHRDIKRLGTTKYNCRCCCCHLQCRATIFKHVDVWDTINWHIRLTFFFLSFSHWYFGFSFRIQRRLTDLIAKIVLQHCWLCGCFQLHWRRCDQNCIQHNWNWYDVSPTTKFTEFNLYLFFIVKFTWYGECMMCYSPIETQLM